ncbi:UNVERIFIED_CONTAM: hypothetical protein HDU68_004346 [Siphonaria sp. JEL0065]|nr:hypothetical protein HDU68_004346 [Siphonaria sp. JEL0065]
MFVAAPLLLLSLSVFSAPVPDLAVAQASSVVVGTCQPNNGNRNTLVFRSLTVDTLQTLSDNSLSATFFVTADWVSDNADLAKSALSQGHSLGLDIPDVTNLVSSQPCSGPSCDHPVIQSNLVGYLSNEVQTWNENLDSPPKVVAFTSVSLLNLRGGHMYSSGYGSLEAATGLLGYTVLFVGFGQDTYNHLTAAESSISLSNVFGAPFISTLNSKTTDFQNSRKGREEDVNSAVSAVSFLSANYQVSFVPISTCLGYSV